MGNHEFCTGCGQSDYHTGRSCEEAYPKEYKKRQREKRKQERDVKAAKRAMSRLARVIEKTFSVKVDTWDDNYIRIHFWDAQAALRRMRKRKKAK